MLGGEQKTGNPGGDPLSPSAEARLSLGPLPAWDRPRQLCPAGERSVHSCPFREATTRDLRGFWVSMGPLRNHGP